MTSISKTRLCASVGVVLLTMIALYTTSFGSTVLAIFCYSYHTLNGGE